MSSSSSSSTTHKVLVVGSTGATGKHVVQMLLDRMDTKVVAVARSQEKLMSLLNLKEDGEKNSNDGNTNLVVMEGSLATMTPDEIKDLVEGCSAIVSCLGHNLTLKGMYRDGNFVKETVKKLTKAMPEDCRFILMGSDGIAHPDSETDPERSWFERLVVSLLNLFLPPFKDNELSAEYLFDETKPNASFCDWCIVRPGDLYDKKQDGSKGDTINNYEIFGSPIGSFFGDTCVARSDVAHFMVDLATMESKAFHETYNHKMPVIYEAQVDATADPTNKSTEL